MAIVTATDFLVATGTPGLWVRLRNNVSGTDYYSTAVSDPQGSFTYSVPAGDYSLYTGAVQSVVGTPNLRSAHYQVALRNGDDGALNSLTALSSSPYVPIGIAGSVIAQASDPWFDVRAYGAKGDGVTDDTVAIQAAITAAGAIAATTAVRGSIVWIPPGIYKIMAPLVMLQNGVRLLGAGIYASSIMIPTAGFVGASMVNIQGLHCVIEHLGFQGQSSTTASNPAVDAILVNHGGNGTRLTNLVFFFINSWCINIQPLVNSTTFGTFCSDIHMRLPKQGINIKGGSSTQYSVGFQGFNLLVDGATNGDGFLIDDASDVVVASSEYQVTAGGSSIHIRGRSTAVYFTGVDSGGAAGNTNPSLLIEQFGGNNPKWIKFTGGTLSLGSPGISITNGTHIAFNGMDISNNNTGGAVISGGDLIQFVGCSFALNNTSAAATTYDLSVTATGPRVVATECNFDSASVTTAVNAVASNKLRLGQCFFNQAIGVNEFRYAQANTGSGPTLGIDGLDTNVAMTFAPKGQASIFFAPDGISDYLQLNPQTALMDLIAAGGSTNIGIRLFPKGSSSVQLVGDASISGHLISAASGTPTTTNLGANVTSATFTGNDTRGTIAIVMSGALAANTRVCTATFAVSYGATSPKVTLVDQTSAVGLTIVNAYVLAQSTGVSFDIAFDQALAAGTYIIDYIVIG